MLAGDLFPADPAVGLTGAGEEQAEIVVDLRCGRDGRTRIAAGAALLDGDRGGQARDIADRRLLHLFEELPGVGTERFDVLAPALGVDRVERQRTLARAADARDDHELVARDAQADVLEVVLGGTGDRDDLVVSLRHIVNGPNPSIPILIHTNPPFLGCAPTLSGRHKPIIVPVPSENANLPSCPFSRHRPAVRLVRPFWPLPGGGSRRRMPGATRAVA